MATVFRDPIRRKNPVTGKLENAYDKNGKQLFHPNWRTIVYTHDNKRKSVTFGTNKAVALKNAEMLETREREIRSGVRALPTPEDENIPRPIKDVLDEYYEWGKARGGRRSMPWDDEYADKKERNLTFWKDCLGLKQLGDLYGIMSKVEKECHKMLANGNTGKTVTNKVLDLRALINWCKKRKYLTEDPLAELGKFDTTPQTIRRAMTVEELRALLAHCAPHRRLLYEVAFSTGLREDELRKLEPSMLDREECAIRIPKAIDKGRKNRVQYIPGALLERLLASVEKGEAKAVYARTYKNQGERVGKKKPPKNPLLYVPTNSSTMLKRDLAAANIPDVTAKGVLDFHALRTAYIDFVLDVAPDVKTAQELARHETADMTLNVYGRAKEDRCRSVVEKVGSLVFQEGLEAGYGRGEPDSGHAKHTINTRGHENAPEQKTATLGDAEGCSQKNMVRKRGLEQLAIISGTSDTSVPNMENSGHNGTHPRQIQEVSTSVRLCVRTEPDVSATDADAFATTKIAQGLHKDHTRVSCPGCQNQGDIPEAICHIIDRWQTFSKSIRDGITVMLQSVLNSNTDT